MTGRKDSQFLTNQTKNMKTYTFNKATPTSLKVNKGYIGESIEKYMARILNNKEPIKGGSPIIYTERDAGVIYETNIRSDRFERAVELTDKKANLLIAKRGGKNTDSQQNANETNNADGKGGGEPASQQGTGGTEATK